MTFFLTYVPFVIFTGAHSVQSFDVSKEREHCRIGQHRYLVDLPEHDCSIILRFSQHQGIGIETMCQCCARANCILSYGSCELRLIN